MSPGEKAACTVDRTVRQNDATVTRLIRGPSPIPQPSPPKSSGKSSFPTIKKAGWLALWHLSKAPLERSHKAGGEDPGLWPGGRQLRQKHNPSPSRQTEATCYQFHWDSEPSVSISRCPFSSSNIKTLLQAEKRTRRACGLGATNIRMEKGVIWVKPTHI